MGIFNSNINSLIYQEIRYEYIIYYNNILNNSTKTNTSRKEEYSKVMGELFIRNSAKFFRKFAIRKSVKKHKIEEGDCLLKTQL